MCVLCQDMPRGVKDPQKWRGKYARLTNWVSYSKDGKTRTEPVQLQYHDSAGSPIQFRGEIFHMAWHGGKAYPIPRMYGLFVSDDGIRYKRIGRASTTPKGARCALNEVALRIFADGEMVALCRNNKPPGEIATSKPPYPHWDVCNIPYYAHGPNFGILPDGQMWAVTRGPDDFGKIPGYHTVHYKMTRNSYEPMLTLPLGGDTSYAGVVWHDGFLWVSYCSSYERKKLGKKAAMYLAKIQLPSG